MCIVAVNCCCCCCSCFRLIGRSTSLKLNSMPTNTLHMYTECPVVCFHWHLFMSKQDRSRCERCLSKWRVELCHSTATMRVFGALQLQSNCNAPSSEEQMVAAAFSESRTDRADMVRVVTHARLFVWSVDARAALCTWIVLSRLCHKTDALCKNKLNLP